jgi:hypothetical protein
MRGLQWGIMWRMVVYGLVFGAVLGALFTLVIVPLLAQIGAFIGARNGVVLGLLDGIALIVITVRCVVQRCSWERYRLVAIAVTQSLTVVGGLVLFAWFGAGRDLASSWTGWIIFVVLPTVIACVATQISVRNVLT